MNLNDPKLEKEVFGLKFKNPIGLAAGFDKDAKLIDELAAFGFGFIEVGTVTPKGQPGNPKPRLFRLPEDQSLINRLGFNNEGLEATVKRLRGVKNEIVIGGNIGKNKATPNEEALNDYTTCFESLYPYVDYFVVNVSSPNTPGLRELQDKKPLSRLLTAIQKINHSKEKPKPVLLKIAPDITEEQLNDILEIVQQTKLAGIIATNTTVSREGLNTNQSTVQNIGAGGLSGKALSRKSTELIKKIHEKTHGQLPIIGVGGIFTGADVKEKMEAGASLVQVYTGFFYEGPSMVKKINQYLARS